MSWLSDFGGFTNKKVEALEQRVKATELQIQAPNPYIENLVRNMFFRNDIKFNNDSTSFVIDGYGGNVSIYSIINYLATTAPNIKFKAQILESGVWADDEGAEIIKLINKPNPLTTYSLFIEETLGWKFIDGAYYVFGPRIPLGKNKGKPLELWTMPSTRMNVVGGGIRKPIEGFRYEMFEDLIDSNDVMYGRYFNPVSALDNLAGSLTGMPPLRSAVLTAKKSNSAAQAGVSAYENNGAQGIVSRDSGEFAEFGEEAAKALREQHKSDYGGANNFGTVGYTGAQIKYHPMSMSPADLRLGESELQSMRQMGGVFKFPTQLINDSEGATFSNQAEAQKSIYTNTLIPEMRGLGEGIMNTWGESFYGNVEARLIPDTSEIEVLQQDKAAQATWLVNAWWLTGNQKLEEQNFEKSDDPRMDEIQFPNTATASSDLDILGDINPANASSPED